VTLCGFEICGPNFSVICGLKNSASPQLNGILSTNLNMYRIKIVFKDDF
jgi:hypothetical protein